MAELGELDKHHQDFESRNVRIVAISNDDLKDAETTKAKFPHLEVVSDSRQDIAKALSILGPQKGPSGEPTNSPTTILVDGTGTVRWLFRPDRFIVRLSPAALLAEIDAHLAK
jgi:peroxiredoxin